MMLHVKSAVTLRRHFSKQSHISHESVKQGTEKELLATATTINQINRILMVICHLWLFNPDVDEDDRSVYKIEICKAINVYDTENMKQDLAEHHHK